jgi:putative transposase
MPRQPRFYFPGVVLHAVQRGNNRAACFARPADYRFYLESLRDAARENGVAIHAYVLMTNHVHLLVSPGLPEALPRVMQTLGRRYVGRFNFLYHRTGTLWEGRYKAALVDDDAYLLTCMRYIELNPVRAGMAALPERYRWSSHRANALGMPDPLVSPHAVYRALGLSPLACRTAYSAGFADGLSLQALAAIRDATQYEWALGSKTFRARVARLTGRRTERSPLGRPSKTPGEVDCDPTSATSVEKVVSDPTFCAARGSPRSRP